MTESQSMPEFGGQQDPAAAHRDRDAGVARLLAEREADELLGLPTESPASLEPPALA